MNRVKIKDDYSLERDTSSKAVINTNVTAYNARKKQLGLKEDQLKEFSQMKSDIAEIKELLQNLGK